MPIGLTAKIEPKNNGFTGLVGADQVIGASGAGGYLPSSTISGNSIQEYQLKISNSPSDTYYLQYKDSTDKLTWAEVSANDVAWSGASGYIGHSSNVDIHFASSNILNWLDGEYQQSGTQGGISSWYDLDTGAGVTPFGGSVSVSGTQAESISILGYDTISSNAKKGQASGALALYDETYSSEGDLTSVLNDNYAGSSNINITLLNTISSNLDTKIDGKEDSLDGYEYYPSTMGNSLSGSYHIHSVDSSIHFTKVSIDDDYAGSGAFQTHKDDLTIHNISGTTALDWLNSSGTKYNSAYVSTSTGIFALVGHTHDLSGSSWSGATGYVGHSSNTNNPHEVAWGDVSTAAKVDLEGDYAPSSGYHTHINDTSNPHTVVWSDVSTAGIADLNDNYQASGTTPLHLLVTSLSSQVVSGGVFYTTAAEPTDDRQLANKQYVDDKNLPLSGLTDVVDGFNVDAYHDSGLKWNKATGKWVATQVAGGGGAVDNYTVRVDSVATADYIGATSNDGVLRVGATMTYADGVDYVTIGVDESAILTTISSNAKAAYDFSSNSALVKNGFAQKSNGETITHGLGAIPNNVSVTPSGMICNFGVNCKVDVSNITVYMTAPGTRDIFWEASV